jgi:hypothetical protein
MGKGRGGAGRKARRGMIVSAQAVNDLPAGIKLDTFRLGATNVVEYAFDVDGVEGVLRVSRPQNNSVGRSVTFEVEGSLYRAAVEMTTGVGVVRRALRAWRYEVSHAPEGTLFSATAAKDDGYGRERGAFYRALGFGEPSGLAGTQYGVVRDGRLTPVER